MNKCCATPAGKAATAAPLRPDANRSAPAPAPQSAGLFPEAHLVLQAYGSPAQLARLLPQRWAQAHTIEMDASGLCIRGPEAEAIGAQLCHAADLLGLLGVRGARAADVLMDTPGGVSLWQALSIRETPDWGRIQGDASACLQLLQQLQSTRFLLACHLFVQLTPELQCSVLRATPAFGQSVVQRLQNELTAARSLQHLPLSTAQWCALELDRLDCQGLVERMDAAFGDLCRRAIAHTDPRLLAVLLDACPEGALCGLLRAVSSLPRLAQWCEASPALEAALREAGRRVRPEPAPRPAP